MRLITVEGVVVTGASVPGWASRPSEDGGSYNQSIRKISTRPALPSSAPTSLRSAVSTNSASKSSGSDSSPSGLSWPAESATRTSHVIGACHLYFKGKKKPRLSRPGILCHPKGVDRAGCGFSMIQREVESPLVHILR